MAKHLSLVVLLGPTASGKTDLAIKLAKKFGGEIICADSRTVYKGMDIGTAKPTAQECRKVPHWGLDLVEPNEPFSAADFKAYAEHQINEIRKRGNIPFLVGGTGLYIDAIIFDYKFGPKANPELRAKLEKLSIEKLHEYCRIHTIQLPENKYNKRYVIREIEKKGQPVSRMKSPIGSTIIVGISTSKDQLLLNINKRTEHIFKNGVVEETTALVEKYGWHHESMTANIYTPVREFLEGSMDLEQAKTKFTTLDRRLAKRQLTWFRRNPYIVWLPKQEVTRYLVGVLANE